MVAVLRTMAEQGRGGKGWRSKGMMVISFDFDAPCGE
jgi:hypothetical protein